MKRVVIPVSILLIVVLLGAGLFVLPTYQLQSSLADLAAALPPGNTLTFGKSEYSLLKRTVTMDDVHLQLKSGSAIDAGEIVIVNGNAGIDKAFKAAAASPDAGDLNETRIADHLSFQNLHSVQGPVEITVGRADVDGLRLSLRSLLAPVAPELAAGTAPADPPADSMVRQIARGAIAVAYDRLALTNAAIKGSQTAVAENGASIADLTITGYDHGDVASTSLHQLALHLPMTTDISVIAGTVSSGNVQHRAFWTSVRAGQKMADAVQQFQGAAQTIDDVTIARGSDALATIQQITFGSLGYGADGLTSMDAEVKALSFDTAMGRNAMSALLNRIGYDHVTLDLSSKMAWDHKAGTASLDPMVLTMENGGKLSLNLAMSNAGADALPKDYKLNKLTLRYEEQGLFAKYLGWLATQEKLTTGQVEEKIVGLMEKQRPNFAADKPLAASFDALEAFVRDPKSLTVSLAPPVPVGLADFDAKQPQGFTSKLGMTVTADQ